MLLLQRMTEEKRRVRPAVISKDIGKRLNEFRGFRHVVRNVYTYRFDSAKVEKLVGEAPAMFVQLKLELSAFADFLEQGD